MVTGNFQPPVVTRLDCADHVCWRCYQVGHLESGCKVWVHWSSYANKKTHSTSPSRDELLLRQDNAYDADVDSLEDADNNDKNEFHEQKKEGDEKQYEDDEKWDNSSDEEINREDTDQESQTCESCEDDYRDEITNLRLEGFVPLNNMHMYDEENSEDRDSMSNDETSPDESEANEQTPLHCRHIWCYNCGEDFHLADDCTNSPDAKRVHRKLFTDGAWDEDGSFDKDEHHDQETFVDTQLLFADDHFS